VPTEHRVHSCHLGISVLVLPKIPGNMHKNFLGLVTPDGELTGARPNDKQNSR